MKITNALLIAYISRMKYENIIICHTILCVLVLVMILFVLLVHLTYSPAVSTLDVLYNILVIVVRC